MEMEYCQALDGLPRIVHILFAIFLPILHLIYAVIYDVSNNNMVALILDLVSFIAGGIVYWILNLIFVLLKNQVFSFSYYIK